MKYVRALLAAACLMALLLLAPALLAGTTYYGKHVWLELERNAVIVTIWTDAGWRGTQRVIYVQPWPPRVLYRRDPEV